MQEEIEKLKKLLPKRGAYSGILHVNKEIYKKAQIQRLTLQLIKNFYSGRAVAETAQDAIIISTQNYLQREKDKLKKRTELMKISVI